MDDNQTTLATIVARDENSLGMDVVDQLLVVFNPYFEEAKKVRENALSIIVKDKSDIETITKAKEAKKVIVEIRKNAEKKRVEVKEKYLKTTQAIDRVAGVVKSFIEPIESHLDTQARFVEIEEMKEREAKLQDRTNTLLSILDSGSQLQTETIELLKVMTDEAFNVYCNNERDASIARLNKLKEEQENKYRSDAVESIKRQAELYKLEIPIGLESLLRIESREKFDNIIKTTTEAMVKEIDEIRKKNEEIEKENARLRKIQEEADLKAKQEQVAEEKRRKEEMEAEAKKVEEANKAALAPDREKLLKFANRLLELDYPEVTQDSSKELIIKTKDLIKKVSVYIINNLENPTK